MQTQITYKISLDVYKKSGLLYNDNLISREEYDKIAKIFWEERIGNYSEMEIAPDGLNCNFKLMKN